jgi:hypothetical protein
MGIISAKKRNETWHREGYTVFMTEEDAEISDFADDK